MLNFPYPRNLRHPGALSIVFANQSLLCRRRFSPTRRVAEIWLMRGRCHSQNHDLRCPAPPVWVIRVFSTLSSLAGVGLGDTQRSLRKASGESPASFAIPPIVKALIGFPRGIVRRRLPLPITIWPLCRTTENPAFSRARTASLWEMPGIFGIVRGGQRVTSSR